ncbi:MAG: DUF3488 and transglutaminase-like domain-containing protein [Actinobacteria bacterium]|nr:DUF3488 and transglutaminase-like domain-containing protein [Actinomycetota bacterium]
MAAPKPPSSQLLELEEHALEQLEAEANATPATEEPDQRYEVPLPVGRLAGVVAFSTIAGAVMVGGVFRGFGARPWGAVAGVLGILLAVWVFNLKNPWTLNAAVLVGIFLIGVVLTIPGGSFEDIVNLGPFVREAITSGDVLRPPVPFTLGWRAILGWLMGGLGFTAGWVAIQFRRPALGLVVPLPIVALGAISLPDTAKIPSGLAALVLLALGLGLLSGVEIGEEEQRSLRYEARRAIRALPMVGVIVLLLYFMATRNILFPAPRYDPTQEAQQPRTVPLSEVQDRVLFTVESGVTGPWRMGALDIYKEDEWLLPPFADNRIEEVPADGIIDSELQPGQRATFVIKDLGGAVLPGLPDLVGLIAEGPSLAYDYRTGNIRLAEGQIQPGLEYTVTAGRIPSVEDLKVISTNPSALECTVGVRCSEYMSIPDPPPAVSDLLRRAPIDSLWSKYDFIRNEFLLTVVAAGEGTPVPVPVEKVQDMLAGSKEGTPYEIVAAQAMLARWAGIPSRIGYGFDGGDPAGELVEVRPRHGASFVEVYFPGYKWLPIIGTPLQARSDVSSENTQLSDEVLASDDISVQVWVPFQTDPRTFLFEQIRAVMAVLVPIILGLVLLYYLWPGLYKTAYRARRRSWAANKGPRERIAVAYADWRDVATDFGYQYPADTPLMFLDRATEDEEHTELAWLVTRCLWGDFQEDLSDNDALTAEELSRSIRRRMSQAHTLSLRFIAGLSRLSLRRPFSPALSPLVAKAIEQREREAKVLATRS